MAERCAARELSLRCAAFAAASHNLGASPYILRYREQARLVADIAAGRIDETGARQRAIAMLEGAA